MQERRKSAGPLNAHLAPGGLDPLISCASELEEPSVSDTSSEWQRKRHGFWLTQVIFASVHPKYASCTAQGSRSKSQALCTAAGYPAGAIRIPKATVKAPRAVKTLKPRCPMAQMTGISREDVARCGRWLGEVSWERFLSIPSRKEERFRRVEIPG